MAELNDITQLETAHSFAQNYLEGQFTKAVEEKMNAFDEELSDFVMKNKHDDDNEKKHSDELFKNSKPEVESKSENKDIENEDEIKEAIFPKTTIQVDVHHNNHTIEQKIPEALDIESSETTVQEIPECSTSTVEYEDQSVTISKNDNISLPVITGLTLEETTKEKENMTEKEPQTTIANGDFQNDYINNIDESHKEIVSNDNVLEPGISTLINLADEMKVSNIEPKHSIFTDHSDEEEKKLEINFKKMGISKNWWKEKRALNEKKKETNVTIDKFLTIKQNIKRGNTRSLKEHFENMSKLSG